MIDEKDFKTIKKEMECFEEERESLIKKSRDILSDSKKVIYHVHRGEYDAADKLLKKIDEVNIEIKKQIKQNIKLDFVGMYSVAIQEFVEAQCFYGFVKNKKIPTCQMLNVQIEDYLLGICDLTGELGRRAVQSVIKKEFAEVYLIRDLVDEIYGLFLQFNLRNSELRKKSDSIKWNLKKIEDIIYDIKTKGMD